MIEIVIEKLFKHLAALREIAILIPIVYLNQNVADGIHFISFKINEKCWRNYLAYLYYKLVNLYDCDVTCFHQNVFI